MNKTVLLPVGAEKQDFRDFKIHQAFLSQTLGQILFIFGDFYSNFNQFELFRVICEPV